ncbi:MAG: hypothetical protein ACJ764_05755 [Solirubrobacteraceae bacterium]
MGRVRVVILLGVLGLLWLPGSALATQRVPRGFVGMMADGPLFDPAVNLSGQFDRMVKSGVQSLRVAFNWNLAQPYARWSQIPRRDRKHFSRGQGGVPTNFYATDRIVTRAARYGLSLLPVVTYAPAWDGSASGNHLQPAHDAPYARYLTILVKRYGPHGSFWASHRWLRRQPITSWQIWNEPDLAHNWNTTPFAPSYVKLLGVAHRAIKRADPTAQVVLAAMTNYGWTHLESIYSIPGSRRLFDVATCNAYASEPTGVIANLTKFREVMDTHGDRHKPLLATELGWPSALGKTSLDFGINTTEQGQAKKLSALLPLLAKNRHRLRLAGFYYYTWLTADPRNASPFAYSGLLRFHKANSRISTKPAYFAFRRAALKLEGCNRGRSKHHACRA